jgi:hypothetical protein
MPDGEVEMRHEWVDSHLAHQLDALPLVLGTASPETLSQRPSSGKWSTREHLAHVAERDADWPAWSKVGLPEILKRLQGLRTTLVQEVDAISESDRRRVGVHATYGAMDVTAWLVFFLLHEAHHLYTIMGQRGGA